MARKIAYLGMFTALALVLGWLETLIPIYPLVPGMKLGLANVVTLLVLYRFGWKEAGCVNLLRIGLSGMLFGNLSLVFYSLAGAVLSLASMMVLKKTDWFSITGVSVSGGVMHNLGQLFMAVFLMENVRVVYYAPVLLVTGTVSGVLIGMAGAFLHRHLPTEIG
ncbi:MAG: Gx transporter family protein [Bacteroides sp.]|nr:Gx transporter family protein [Bacteroides sp.]MCM1550710.1 Gx transporter family protein [Clostridium sp.]